MNSLLAAQALLLAGAAVSLLPMRNGWRAAAGLASQAIAMLLVLGVALPVVFGAAPLQGEQAWATELLMSQDFQDLSGQVIKKVIDIISRTETQLLQLLSQSAPEHLAAAAAVAAAATSEQLQGPQTPEKALKQDDVDDLLSSLGF